MLLETLLEKADIRSPFTKLLVGSIVAAVAISLGMVWILDLFGFSIGPGLPAALGAIGAAMFAARMRQ